MFTEIFRDITTCFFLFLNLNCLFVTKELPREPASVIEQIAIGGSGTLKTGIVGDCR